VVTCGDLVNELQVLLAGQAFAVQGNGDTVLSHDGATSVHGGNSRLLCPGDTAGEMAFFTETPCMEVRTVHVLAGAVCVDKGGNKGRGEEVVAHLCGEVQLL
jgi:hypothetical protein